MFGRYDDKSFRAQLEKNLSWLRQRILNLDDYVPREEFDALQERQNNLLLEKKSLQAECSALKNYAASLKDELSAAENNLLSLFINRCFLLQHERVL